MVLCLRLATKLTLAPKKYEPVMNESDLLAASIAHALQQLSLEGVQVPGDDLRDLPPSSAEDTGDSNSLQSL